MKKLNVLALSDHDINKVVKIQGTQYDRRRKISDKELELIADLYEQGESYSGIADQVGYSPRLVRYHLDANFRRKCIDLMTGESVRSKSPVEEMHDRAAYKRDLVARGRLIV